MTDSTPGIHGYQGHTFNARKGILVVRWLVGTTSLARSRAQGRLERAEIFDAAAETNEYA